MNGESDKSRRLFALYDTEGGELVEFARRSLRRWRAASLIEAEELVHETLAQIASSQSPLPEEPTQLSAYVKRAIRNRAVDEVRRRVAQERAISPDHVWRDATTSREEKLAADEVQMIRKALSRISREELRAVKLSVFDDLPIRDVARVLRTSKSEAHRILTRAIAKLAAWLSGLR